MVTTFEFEIPYTVPIVALLNVHPFREPDLLEPDELHVEPEIPIDAYVDSFGNRCSRFVAPAGTLRLYSSTLIKDSGEPDRQDFFAREVPVGELPTETLQFLLASRYCEVDLLSNVASELFGDVPRGYGRVQAICSWVSQKVTFGYNYARLDQDGSRCLHRAGWCLPGFSAPRHFILQSPEHSRPVRYRLPGRYRRPGISVSDGL